MQISLIEIITVIGAIPEWFWIVPSLFLLLILTRMWSSIFQQTKLDGALYLQNSELMAEVTKLTAHKARLIAWSSKAIRHFSGCGGCVFASQDASRDELEAEYNEMMVEMV